MKPWLPVKNLVIDKSHRLSRGLVEYARTNSNVPLTDIQRFNIATDSTNYNVGEVTPEYTNLYGLSSYIATSDTGLSGWNEATFFVVAKNVGVSNFGRILSVLYSGNDDIRIYQAGETSDVLAAWDDGTPTVSATFSGVLGTGGTLLFMIAHTGTQMRTFVQSLDDVTFNQYDARADTFSFAGADGLCRIGGSGTNQLPMDVISFGYWNRALNEAEMRQFATDPYQIFKPAIDLPVFVAPAGGITVTGSLNIGGITISSTGERSITGDGALALGGVQIDASGEREVPASGALAVGGAALDGAGGVGGNVSGSGALAAGPVALDASGERQITGAAALSLGGAQLDASGERSISGAAALATGGAALDGSGAVGGVIGGSGALSVGAVALAASADRTVNGAAALAFGGAMLDGAGALAGNISGSGSLTMGGVQIASTGERTISGIGSLTVGAALLSGTALAGIVYFYSYPEDSARGGTLISPTRGGTLSRYEV